MRARDRFFGVLEIGQQLSLLGWIKDVSKPDRGVARQRCRRLVHGLIAARFAQRRQRFLHRSGRSACGHLHRDRSDAQAARAKLFVLEPKRRQVGPVVSGGGNQ